MWAMPSLAPEERHDLALFVERDAETIVIVDRHRRAELGGAPVGGVLVVARVAHAFEHGLDHVGRRGRVGVADARG